MISNPRLTLLDGVPRNALGTLTTPARGAEPDLEHFELALLDANPDKSQIEWVNTGKVDGNGRFLRQRDPLKVGWQPLELKYRWLPWINGDESGGVAYMIVGGDTKNGRVVIHRQSDGKQLASVDGLSMYPHSIEYLPSANAIVVVGTRTPGLPGGGGRRGGCYQLFTAPRNSGGAFTPVGGPHQFRQAHGVAWQYHKDNPGAGLPDRCIRLTPETRRPLRAQGEVLFPAPQRARDMDQHTGGAGAERLRQ